jgi:hypothetical protein
MDSEATCGLGEFLVISDASSDIGIIESLTCQDRDLTWLRHELSPMTDNAVIRDRHPVAGSALS